MRPSRKAHFRFFGSQKSTETQPDCEVGRGDLEISDFSARRRALKRATRMTISALFAHFRFFGSQKSTETGPPGCFFERQKNFRFFGSQKSTETSVVKDERGGIIDFRFFGSQKSTETATARAGFCVGGLFPIFRLAEEH